ncbi:MAG: DUF3795 domain-containing protein [Candidatus Eisenbacteria bacterium]|nr:DUF3795 domain-containing protein [Candidatus Eisenbacteria bacterium]
MEMKPNREAFERVRDQVGFCGIWCGSCAVGNGSVGERGAELRELLVAYDAPQFAAIGIEWDRFLEALDALKQAVACPGCRAGGGRDDCEIRACALRRQVDQCTGCVSFGGAGCEEPTILEQMRSGAAKVGLSVLRSGEKLSETTGPRAPGSWEDPRTGTGTSRSEGSRGP